MPNSIPLRKFGNKEVHISALGLGGHHLGDAKDESTAIRIVAEAIDGGVTFFDNCWEYNRGKSENWMGKALKGKRDSVFLMTKVCTHGVVRDLSHRKVFDRRLDGPRPSVWIGCNSLFWDGRKICNLHALSSF